MSIREEFFTRVGKLRVRFHTMLITTNSDTITRWTWTALGLDRYFTRL